MHAQQRKRQEGTESPVGDAPRAPGFPLLVLFRNSIAIKISPSSIPVLSPSLNPNKGLKLAVSAGACHSHNSLCQ